MSEALCNLAEHHKALIRASGISPKVASERGYRTVTTKSYLGELGFSRYQCTTPSLVFPIYGVTGEIVNYQVRPDVPRISRKGKPAKYETPPGSRMHVDFPPATRSKIGDPTVTLYITEGVRKADSAVSRGLCCIALLGVWNFRGKNAQGGIAALPEWEFVALNDRLVRIAFDSDVTIKPQVYSAIQRLRGMLEHRGARIEFVLLPPGPGGTKVGLDDFLAADHTEQDLEQLLVAELPKPGGPECDEPYEATESGLVHVRDTQNGPVIVPLTNFTGRISSEVVHDDGVELHRDFQIEASLDKNSTSFLIPASRFSSMEWITEHLGARAVVYAGFGIRDHTRTAIQILSGNVESRTVYTHTGWRQIDKYWFYLHAGGAIGTNGTVSEIEVQLQEGAHTYVLPDPPDRVALERAVQASLRILKVGPASVVWALWCAIWRSVLGTVDFSIHITGKTGVFKSEIAALIQQHFGASMDRLHLPGSWLATGNALLHLAFKMKDAILVVDDFAPTGSASDIQRQNREADRLLRAQGNRAGRARLTSDARFKPAKEPRSLILSTGEETPNGHSIRARLLTLELKQDDIDIKLLSQCQEEARQGQFATALAGFIHWLSSRYSEIQAGLGSRVRQIRDDLQVGGHRRHASTIADLLYGWEVFARFAKEADAVAPQELERLERECRAALLEAASDQAEGQSAADPAPRFIELLRSAVSSGTAHIADPSGDPPAEPQAWGWRPASSTGERWVGHGDLVGWLEGDDLFLDPIAAYKAAQRMANPSGDALAIQPTTLWKRLKEAGLLGSVESSRKRNTIRRQLQGQRREVLHFRLATLFPPAPSQSSQASQSPIPLAQGLTKGDHPKAASDTSEADSGREVGEI